MGKTKKVLAMVLSLVMAVQTPVIAGELIVDEEIMVDESVGGEELITEEEAVPDEFTVVEDVAGDGIIEENLSDAFAEPEGELTEESPNDNELSEDGLLEENFISEELVGAPVDDYADDYPSEEAALENVEEIQEELSSGEVERVGDAMGTCGDNLTWTLRNGVLTIFGTGSMDNYGSADDYWDGNSKLINEVVINEGITSIGTDAFLDCTGIKKVIIGDDVTKIGKYAFGRCASLEEVIWGKGLKVIDEQGLSSKMCKFFKLALL